MPGKKLKFISAILLCAFLLYNADKSLDGSKSDSLINGKAKSVLFIKNNIFNKIKIDLASNHAVSSEIYPFFSNSIKKIDIYNHPLFMCNKYPVWSKGAFKYYL